jgi:N-acetylneuraminate lyase
LNAANLSLSGIYPAFLTPLGADGNISEETAVKWLRILLEAGVDGVYLGGSTGEGMYMSEEQRKRLLMCILSAMPGEKKTLVHVGSADIDSALRLARHAAQAGADAISSLPPAGDAATVFRYYERLAGESSLPVIVYYFPEIAPHAFPEQADLRRVCELDGVVGVKFTDYNLFLLQQLVEAELLVFNGRDEVLVAGLLMGASGGIGSTYNLMPGYVVDLARAAGTGDWKQARDLQSRVNHILQVMLRYPYLPALKSACGHRSGLEFGGVLDGSAFHDDGEEAQFLQELDACSSSLEQTAAFE